MIGAGDGGNGGDGGYSNILEWRLWNAGVPYALISCLFTMHSDEVDPEDQLSDLPSSSSGPKAHTRNFDRVAHYGTLADRWARRNEPFLRSCRGQLITKYLYTVNVLFAVMALITIIAGITIGQSHNATHQVVGVIGDRFALICSGFGVCMFGFALLGCAATKTNMRFLLLVYSIVLLLLLVAFGMLMITEAAASRSDKVKQMVQSAWESRVVSHAGDLCDLQHDMQCSGFTSNCSGQWTNDTRPSDCPACHLEKDSHYPNACWNVLQAKIHENLKPLLYISIITFVVLGMALMGALYMCQRLKVSNREYRLYETIRSDE